jgi:hypothetical protein
LDQHLGCGQQRTELFAIVGLVKVQHHSGLVGIEIEEQRALVAILNIARERPPGARDVALRRLDLDNIGAEQRHQFAGKGGGYAVAVLDDRDSSQGEWCVSAERLISGCGCQVFSLLLPERARSQELENHI